MIPVCVPSLQSFSNSFDWKEIAEILNNFFDVIGSGSTFSLYFDHITTLRLQYCSTDFFINADTKYGVPQGLIVGSLIFNMYRLQICFNQHFTIFNKVSCLCEF